MEIFQFLLACKADCGRCFLFWCMQQEIVHRHHCLCLLCVNFRFVLLDRVHGFRSLYMWKKRRLRSLSHVQSDYTGEVSCWWSCDRLTSDLSRLIWPSYAGRFLRRIEHLIGDAETRLVFTDWFSSVVLMQNIHKENFIERESGIFSSSAGAKLARKQFPTNAQCFCQYTSEIHQMWNEWTTRRVGLLVRDTVRKFSHSIFPTLKWGFFKTYKCEILDFPWELLEDKS